MEEAEKLILKTLSEKSDIKFKIYDATKDVLNQIKKDLAKLSKDYNKQLKNVDPRVLLEYREKSEFECELKVAGDLVIFTMHTNVFEFDHSHSIWNSSYVADNEINSYCGMINIYNFLSDSFKYERNDDLGYLIGRIFINKEKHFFVEGKRQLGFLYADFANAIINKESIRRIINSAILYTLDFDLLVPNYDDAKIATVSQMLLNTASNIKTGKRLGFKFYADEVPQDPKAFDE